jgi:hypothetical protein
VVQYIVRNVRLLACCLVLLGLVLPGSRECPTSSLVVLHRLHFDHAAGGTPLERNCAFPRSGERFGIRARGGFVGSADLEVETVLELVQAKHNPDRAVARDCILVCAQPIEFPCA